MYDQNDLFGLGLRPKLKLKYDSNFLLNMVRVGYPQYRPDNSEQSDGIFGKHESGPFGQSGIFFPFC